MHQLKKKKKKRKEERKKEGGKKPQEQASKKQLSGEVTSIERRIAFRVIGSRCSYVEKRGWL